MHSLLPSSPLGRVDANGLIVRSRGGLAVEFIRRQRGVREDMGEAVLDDAGLPRAHSQLASLRIAGPVVLELPTGLLHQQQAVLPLAAETELGRVLHHEMDRLTPFAATAIFWSWTVVQRDRINGRLTVQLSIVLKLAVQPLLNGIERLGMQPAVIEVCGADGLIRRIGILPPGTNLVPWIGTMQVMIWTCAMLALVALALPLTQQHWAMTAVDDRISDLQPRVASVAGLRQRLATSSSSGELFAGEAGRSGHVLQAMAAITRALPDDTYLTDLTLRDRKLTLTGRSASAVRLIGLLATAPELSNPAFAAPVVRTAGDRGDQFTISADLAP